MSWPWIQTWVGQCVPLQVQPHSEALLLLLKTHFKKQTVNSEELGDIGEAIDACSAYVTKISSMWSSSNPFDLKSFRNLCDVVLAKDAELSLEEWTDSFTVFEAWRSQNRNQSLHVVIEKVRKTVRATSQRSKRRMKERLKRRNARAIAASHRSRCESCGELLEKGEHCECNWN